MAITYSSPNGTIITSAAMDETLGDQSQQTGNNTVVVSDDIVTAGNGQIGTNTAYDTRLIIIDQGLSSEQIRMCISDVAGTGNTRILTVHEDWDTNPAQNDTIHVAYQMDDIENGGASGGVTFTARSGLYDFTNTLTIGNATDFAFLQLCFSESMIINDSKATSSPEFIVENNGWFQVGYLHAGQAINGGYISGDNDADGEEIWDILDGGYLFLYDLVFKNVLNDLKWEIVYAASPVASKVSTKDLKFYQAAYNVNLSYGTWDAIKWTGASNANDYVRITDDTTIIDWILISTNGFHTIDGDTNTETVIVRDVLFVDNSTLITVNSNKTWDVINPTWSVDTFSHDDILFLTATSNSVNEKYSLDLIVQQTDGTKLQDTVAVIYEGTQDDLVQELVSGSTGLIAGSWIYRTMIDAQTGPAAAEVTEITTVADVSGTLSGTCWHLDQPSGGYYVWYDNGVPTDPAPASRTGIQVSYLENDDANTIASGTSVAIDAVTGFGASYAANVVTVTNDNNGFADDAQNGSPSSGFSFLVTTDGENISLGVTLYSDHAYRVDKWLYLPFAAALTSDEALVSTVTLISDGNISETTQSTALAAGSAVDWHEDTYPSSIIDYTAGNGTVVAESSIIGLTSTASGIATEIMSGDSTAGTVHLKDRNAVDFSDGETVSGTGTGWSATYTASTQQDFSIWVDGGNTDLQVIHDYFAAHTSQTTLSGLGELIHEWGRDEQTRAIYKTGSNFYTEQSYSKGIIIVDYGAGSISYFTDDTDVTWTPPAQVTLSIKVIDEDQVDIENAWCYIEDSSQVELMNEQSLGDGTASEGYTYTGDESVLVRVRKYGYKAGRTSATIPGGGLNLTITLIADPQQI